MLIGVLLVGMVGMISSCSQEPTPSRSTGNLRIHGTVFLSSGEPCARCAVALTSSNYQLGEIGYQSDEDGSYAWYVPGPGEFFVEAANPDGRVTETVVVTDEDVELDLTFE